MSASTAKVNSNRTLGDLAGKVILPAALIGVVGVGAALALAATGAGWERFFRSYLLAFLFITSISLGGLFFTLIHHLTRAGWSTVLRRISEAVAGNLTWIWLLFIPVALGTALGWHHLYHWVHPEGDPLLEHKEPYLNLPFWLGRAVFFFAVWALLARFFFRNSVAQDGTGDVALTHRMQRLAPIAIILYALTQSFAAVDWIMSLEAHWFSTMFGVYFFAASTCGFFATMILIMFALQRSGRVENEITSEHYQDAGKLLFAFGIVFWAYIAYSQYMLIWYGNIPEETGWFLARQVGGWAKVSLFLLVGHFVFPFLFLISRHPKRRKAVLAFGGVWMLLLHFVDLYWLVMPAVPADAIAESATMTALVERLEAGAYGYTGFSPMLIDLACAVGLTGLYVAVSAFRMRNVALVPVQDPRLQESLAFENM